MAVLSGILSDLTVKTFSDFPWALILNEGMAAIGFYALRIILLTVCLKIVLFPLDLFQRYKMRKNQVITHRIKPQLERLKIAYADNEKVLQEKQNELHKREGMSRFASCLPMIVTLVIFIWFYTTLQTTAQFKQFQSYIEIYNIYTEARDDAFDGFSDADGELSKDFADDFISAFDIEFSANYTAGDDVDAAVWSAHAQATSAVTPESSADFYDLFTETYATWIGEAAKKFTTLDGAEVISAAHAAAKQNAIARVDEYCSIVAQSEVYDYYFSEGKYAESGYKHDEFLWIKDIWSPDVPWSSYVKQSQAEFTAVIGAYATDPNMSGDPSETGITEHTLSQAISSYDKVMALIIRDTNRTGMNGMLIIPILAIVFNILTQLITRRQQKQSGQTAEAESSMGCMKYMFLITPLMVGYFAITFCAAFSLYMLVNSIVGLIINLITTLIAKKMLPIEQENEAKVSTRKASAETIERYGRPDYNTNSGNYKKK